MVRALLDKGADVHAADENGDTSLMNAAQGGHLPVVRALLDKGAKVNAADEDGDTALSVARMGRHEEVAKFLEERMASGGDSRLCVIS